MTHMRNTFTVAAALAAAVSLAACSPSTDQSSVTTSSPAGSSTAPPAAAAGQRDNALVRFVHAAPAAASVDVYADDTKAFEAVAYKTVTPFEEIEGQRATIRLRPAGAAESEPLAANSEGLDDGDHYTIFAVPGDDEKPMLRVVEDDLTRPADGKARIRVVNAARDAGEIDVVAGDTVVDGVNFQTVSSYAEVDPWAGSLQVKAEGQAAALATVPDVRFDAGKVYTVVVAGRPTAPEAFVIEDQIDTAMTSR